MTYFKKILAIVALFAIEAAHAKQIGKKAITTTPSVTTSMPAPMPTSEIPRTQKSTASRANRPVTQPTQQQPINFEQLYNQVKYAKNAWDYKTQLLSDAFVNQLLKDAQAARISKDDLNFLFMLARACHAQFIGPKKDIDILTDLIEQQKANIDIFSKQGIVYENI